MLDTLLAKVVGTQNDRELKRLRPIVSEVNALEEATRALSDEQLRALLARRTRRTAATLHPRVMTARESKALANRIVH